MVRKLEIQENILAGQRALVTGASSGIGRAIALCLAEAGARVAVNYLHGDDNAEALWDGEPCNRGAGKAPCL